MVMRGAAQAVKSVAPAVRSQYLEAVMVGKTLDGQGGHVRAEDLGET